MTDTNPPWISCISLSSIELIYTIAKSKSIKFPLKAIYNKHFSIYQKIRIEHTIPYIFWKVTPRFFHSIKPILVLKSGCASSHNKYNVIIDHQWKWCSLSRFSFTRFKYVNDQLALLLPSHSNGLILDDHFVKWSTLAFIYPVIFLPLLFSTTT